MVELPPRRGEVTDESIRVLLVEDNRADARLMREMLAEAHPYRFDLIHVERIHGALKHVAQGIVDVILLDLSVPDAHGLDTIKLVCAEASHVPIVVLTSVGDQALAIEAVRAGAQDYLVKGWIDSSLLVHAIRCAIERHRTRAELRSLSLTDDLSGLYNRRGFLVNAEQQVKLARRTRREFLLILIDLDGLKQINDTFGHQEGDTALIRTATILRETFRDSDIIARLGGDEFMVLTAEASRDSAQIVATRLLERVEAYNARRKLPYELSLSVGVACFDPNGGFSLGEVMTQADEALYEHKRSKRRG